MHQSTIARPVQIEGQGLHSGERGNLRLLPGAPDSGIVFIRLAAGVKGSATEIPVCAAAVSDASRSTRLSAFATEAGDSREISVSTVEHLLAALYALEIDNVRIEMDCSEVPALDGSAAPLVDWVASAGRIEQSARRHFVTLEERIEIREGDRSIRAEPAERLGIDYLIDFPHPCIGRQSYAHSAIDQTVFEADLARARTFGFVHELEALREAGLARGGALENAIVLDEEGVLNEGGLRFADEFVRHKVVDLIGDLALLGARLNAQVTVERGGHRLHHELVRAIQERLDGEDV